MTTKFDNLKETIFASKEHYIAFRKAWCLYVNSPDAKPYREECPWGGGIQKRCRLTSAHHLLFCLLTETDLSASFKPSPTDRKNGLEEAEQVIRSIGHAASRSQRGEKSRFGIEDAKRVELFLKPFGNTVTVEMMARLYDEFLKGNKLTNSVSSTKEAA